MKNETGQPQKLPGFSEEAEIQDVNPKKVYKAVSHQNKCIQLADFVAGAVRAESEYSDELFKKLSEKVSVARRH